MNFAEFMTLGVLQGLTEFLPISSSGHLWLLQHWWGFQSNLSLEVFLHGASLLAVLFCLRERIVTLFKALLSGQQERNLALQLLWATVVTVPVALWMEGSVLLNLDLGLVAWSLVLTGIFIGLSTLMKGEKTSLTWSQATLIGLIQGISVLPGISRSGITIVGLLFMGVKREKAAEFSFLLSIPTIVGAVVFTLKETASLDFLGQPNFYFAALLCFVIAVATIEFMLKSIQRTWGIWAVYCLLLGGLLLLI